MNIGGGTFQGKADTALIGTMFGAVDAGGEGGVICGGAMQMNICSIDC